LARKSSAMATMATALGYATAFFSFHEGLGELALGVSLLLAAVAAGLLARKDWQVPARVAAPAALAIYALVLQMWRAAEAPPSPSLGWAYLAGLAGLLLAAELRGAYRRQGALDRARRLLQAGTVAGAVGLGWLTVQALAPQHLSSFYFGAGAATFAAFLLARRVLGPDPLEQAFLVKASALVALGAVAAWGGQVLWLALMTQAIALGLGDRRTPMPAARVMALLVWAVSLSFFIRDCLEGDELAALAAVGMVVELIAGAAALAILTRRRTEMAVIETLGSLALAVATLAFATLFPREWWPLLAVGCVVGWGAVSRLAGWRIGLPAMVAMLGAGSLALLLTEHPGLNGLWRLWLNAGVLIAALAGGSVWLGRHRAESQLHGQGEALGWVAAFAALLVPIFHSLLNEWALAASAGIGLAAALAGQRWRTETLLRLSAFPLGIGLCFMLIYLESPAREPEGLYAAALAAFSLPAALTWLLRARGAAVSRATQVAAIALAVAVGWIAIHENFTGSSILLAAAVGSALVLLLHRWPQALGANIAASAVAAAALLTPWHAVAGADWAIAAAVLAAWTAALPLVAERLDRSAKAPVRGANFWLHGSAALILAFWVFLQQTGPLADYTSVFWGLAASALFLLGLFGRARPYRLLGLVGIALCIPRVFLVDIHDTLHRIAAFGLLGLALLWVGFSYHRFRHLLTDGADRQAEEQA
jgi:hypothetical protein